MSRIGRMPVQIPQGVKVEIGKQVIMVEGAKGKLAQKFLPEIEIKVEDGNCIVARKNDSKRVRSLHGLYRKLIYNMVVGVSQGFSKVLLINGVGYRVELKDKILILNLGYSNPIQYPIPDGIQVNVEGNNKMVISSHDKQRLGQVCSEIRAFRVPEPYKGKGIRYEHETVRRKVGKTGIG